VEKPMNNRAWLLVVPVFVVVAFSAIIPLMTVVNYSVQDSFGGGVWIFVGDEWFREVLRDEALHDAFIRQLIFSFTILAIQIPLGIGIALLLPTRGWGVPASLVLLALPLLVPFNVVGTIWQLFARVDIGLLGNVISRFGVEFNYTDNPVDAWITVIVMDVWHWTPLVALLCYSGLRAIPPAFYEAARIDGASKWATFRYIQLPKLRGVLTIAILLRFMDSFMIFTEPFVVTGGGPGNATNFLSIVLTNWAIERRDLGPSAAFSIIYFLIVLLICWMFYTAITRLGRGDK
jgi:glycerol transport system permease protein